MAGQIAARGQLRLVLLGMLSDGPASGSEVLKRLREESGGRYLPSPGSVYPRLSALCIHGFATAQASAERKKSYTLTRAGRDLVSQRAAEIQEARTQLLG